MTTPSKPIERKKTRFLLIFYDLLVYYIIAFVFCLTYHTEYEYHPLYLVLHFVLLPLCLTVFRLVFRVYLRIWRNPSAGSFARFVLSELVSTVVYLVLTFLLSFIWEDAFYITPLDLISLLTVDVVAVLCFRLLYYYLYQFAEREGKAAKLVRSLIERFGLVDFSAKEEGGVLRVVLESEYKNAEPINDVLAVFYRFAVVGRVIDVKRNNSGYINRTYKVTTVSENDHRHTYILQRINTKVFPDVDALMQNYLFTIEHLKDKLHLPGQPDMGSVAMVKETREGKPYLKDIDGCWRVMSCYNDVFSLDIPDSTEIFHDAGRAFGAFIYDMSDVDPKTVAEVIPNFHNTASRYRDLCRAIEADPVGRAASVQKESDFIHAHKEVFGIIAEKLESGVIPTRVCHNDTNLNNILFDNTTREPVAIIDLDTVMPSTPLYDFGDSMRIGTNTAKDDETDLSKVSCNLDMYRAYASGWLKSCGKILTREELNLLPYACLVITSEDGIRFLMDYINGDTYYNIFYPTQNLDRSRTQLALVADMEKKLPQIKQILKEIYEELGLDGDPYTYDFSA